jgi:hypothetical protein
MFRWAEDGSRLELPVSVRSGRLTARIRLARFAPSPTEVTVEAGGRAVDRWVQPSVGWRVREVDLGELRGPLTLTFRAHGEGSDPTAVAVDWAEVVGAETVRPTSRLAGRLAFYFLGPPLLAWLITRSSALATGVAAFAAAGGRGRGLAGSPGRSLGLRGRGSAGVPRRPRPAGPGSADDPALARSRRRARGRTVALPILFAIAACVAFFHPFCYYPDVDTHGRFLQALRDNPRCSWIPPSPGSAAATSRVRSAARRSPSPTRWCSTPRPGRFRHSSATRARSRRWR